MKVEINTKIKVFPKLYVGLKAQTLYDRETQKKNNAAEAGETVQISGTAAPV